MLFSDDTLKFARITPFSDGPEGHVFFVAPMKSTALRAVAKRFACIFALILLCAGCRPPLVENVAAQLQQDEPAELRFIARRSALLKNVSGSGTMQLTQANGQSVVFDLAAAIEPPNRARFRAWKMGQAVLDLTVLPNALWLETSQQGERKSQLASVGDTTARVTKTLSLLSGGFFDDPAIVGRDEGESLILALAKKDQPTITCVADRRTLCPRRFTMVDSSGVVRFTLMLEDYTQENPADNGGAIWPKKITAVSSMGTVVVVFDDVEINGGLPAGAFTPPAEAEKSP